MKATKPKKRLWQYPWRYAEGFLIALGIIIAGTGIEAFTEGGITMPGWPVNVIIGVVFINILTLLYITLHKHPIVRWFATAPAAITSVALVTFLTLIMGFVPQNPGRVQEFVSMLGLSHIAKSWTFALAQVYFLTVLGLASLKRTSPLTRKNIGFLLNHLGLWIVIAAASLGTGDLQRLNMQLQEGGKFKNTAVSRQNERYRLHIALKLHDFQMELYNPKLAALNADRRLISKDAVPMPMVEEGLKVDMLEWNVQIEEFMKFALPDSNGYRHAPDRMGATPAARIKATKNGEGTVKSGWITSGSFMLGANLLKLDNSLSLALTSPEPKKYASVVEYVTKDGRRDTITIEVNKPFKVNGWKIYQSSYDAKRGKWSKISVLELVRDPWLPVVYIGIFMMIAGAVHIFWIGRGK